MLKYITIVITKINEKVFELIKSDNPFKLLIIFVTSIPKKKKKCIRMDIICITFLLVSK